MIDVSEKLLQAIGESTCFGIAYDELVPECKQCDVKAQCKSKVDGAMIATPTTKPVTIPPVAPTSDKPSKKSDKKPAKETTTANTPATTAAPTKPKGGRKSSKKEESDPNMPDFKSMTLQQLIQTANQRGVEWKDYGHENITRMRLIMALKKSFAE